MSACAIVENPTEQFIRSERMPHIWCPGCGIGTTVNAFARALLNSKLDPKKVAVVSGIGCSGRVAGYVDLDSFHTTHGRAIPFATGLKLANPELTVVVYSGDGDLTAIGGNHLIHAARRNLDIKVICVNNLVYAMTGGQTAPTTPETSTTSTSPFGTFEPNWNMPHLVEAAGACYVARWTTFHVKQLEKAMTELLSISVATAWAMAWTPCCFTRRRAASRTAPPPLTWTSPRKAKSWSASSSIAIARNTTI
jgi:2-oxoglutarate ferredoxin oxidoreductase subunit beta